MYSCSTVFATPIVSINIYFDDFRNIWRSYFFSFRPSVISTSMYYIPQTLSKSEKPNLLSLLLSLFSKWSHHPFRADGRGSHLFIYDKYSTFVILSGQKFFETYSLKSSDSPILVSFSTLPSSQSPESLNYQLIQILLRKYVSTLSYLYSCYLRHSLHPLASLTTASCLCTLGLPYSGQSVLQSEWSF